MTNYFHARTQIQLDALVADLPQSLLIVGPEGIGLTAVIDAIATSLKVMPLTVLPERNEKVDTDNGTITVAIIRRLYELTRSIEPNRRLIVIDHAETMGVEAQNAFLKLLEEPSAKTHFLLLTHDAARLLPTIRSRTQTLELQSITHQQSEALLDELGVDDAQKRSQLLFIADGLPAELSRLATDDGYFAARAVIIRDARSYITGSAYEKLRIAQAYKDDRKKALVLLQDAMRQLQRTLEEGKPGEHVRALQALLKVYGHIEANGNIRLHLASVV